jgi:TolA-binding protein
MVCGFRGKWIVVVLAGSLAGLGAGCQSSETPQVKRDRLIAAQYMDLEQALAERDARIEKLKSQYEQQIKEKDEQLAAYRRKIEEFQNGAQETITDRVNQVTTAVLNENARLRKEIDGLRAQLQQRMDSPPPEIRPQP